MEAYGQKLGRLYCDMENRDFHECLTHEKMVSFWAFWFKQYDLQKNTLITGLIEIVFR